MTINVTSVNDAPAGTDNTITTNEDAAHTFTALEFGFTDPNDSPANALAAVEITTIPTLASGALTSTRMNASPRPILSAADFINDLLVFTPARNANRSPEPSFTFQVTDKGGVANGRVVTDQPANTMTFNVITVNDTPATTINTLSLHDALPISFTALEFGFTDPNDSPANALAAVEITTIPTLAS